MNSDQVKKQPTVQQTNDTQQQDGPQRGVMGGGVKPSAPAASKPADVTTLTGKEQEPAGNSLREIGFAEEAPSEFVEAEKRKEVGEFVKQVPVRPKVPEKLERAGAVKPAGAAVPVKKVSGKKVKLPLTDEQIVTGLHAQVWESIRWLAVWCVRKLKKAHIAVKEVHGRLIRA